MSASQASPDAGNSFLIVPVGRLFLSNALPMAVVLSMGGILTVADGIFVGRFIGPDGLTAVGLAFPAVMITIALSTLVGGGMSSLMARALGAGDRAAAASVFARAHGLALALSLMLIGLFLCFGSAAIDRMAVGNARVAALTWTYLLVLLLGTPVQLVLGIHADALRNEGRAGLIAGLSVAVNLFNIAANWLGIVVLGLGIAGSALGTVAAQVLGLALLVAYRAQDRRLLSLAALQGRVWLTGWRPIVTLGLPLSLGFTGMALVSLSVMLALKGSAGDDYAIMVAGYGVVTRILSLAFLPQMAFALATQSITGNNAGAGLHGRARSGLRLALLTAFSWCVGVAVLTLLAGDRIGGLFTDDPAVAAAVATILRPMMVFYPFSGPILVLALHFQALGQPGRTALLMLVKPWLLNPVMVLVAGWVFGQRAIWFAFPIADAVLLMLVSAMILRVWRPAAGAAIVKERP